MSTVADGPEMKVIGRPSAATSGQRGHAVRHGRDDVFRSDDAQVVVGHERECPAPGGAHPVEHDRARFGDRERASRQHAVQLVELRGARAGDRPRTNSTPSTVHGGACAGTAMRRASRCSQAAISAPGSSSPRTRLTVAR